MFKLIEKILLQVYPSPSECDPRQAARLARAGISTDETLPITWSLRRRTFLVLIFGKASARSWSLIFNSRSLSYIWNFSFPWMSSRSIYPVIAEMNRVRSSIVRCCAADRGNGRTNSVEKRVARSNVFDFRLALTGTVDDRSGSCPSQLLQTGPTGQEQNASSNHQRFCPSAVQGSHATSSQRVKCRERPSLVAATSQRLVLTISCKGTRYYFARCVKVFHFDESARAKRFVQVSEPQLVALLFAPVSTADVSTFQPGAAKVWHTLCYTGIFLYSCPQIQRCEWYNGASRSGFKSPSQEQLFGCGYGKADEATAIS